MVQQIISGLHHRTDAAAQPFDWAWIVPGVGIIPAQFVDASPVEVVCPASYRAFVIRTTVYLDEGDKKRLKAMTAGSATSEAELIRRGVRLAVAAAERPRPHVGYGRSSDGRRASDTVELLAGSGFGAS